MNGPLPKRENSIIEVTLFDSNQLGVWKKNQLKKNNVLKVPRCLFNFHFLIFQKHMLI